jgi:hypothetical protein
LGADSLGANFIAVLVLRAGVVSQFNGWHWMEEQMIYGMG